MSEGKMPWWAWLGLVGGAGWLLLKSQETSASSGGSKPPVPVPPSPPQPPPVKPPVIPPVVPASVNTAGFSTERKEREQQILDAVKAGSYDANWVPITSKDDKGNTARFWVMNDALKVNGVRVTASAALEQQIADLMSARLLTPKLADLIYEQATIRLPPMPRDVSTNALMSKMDSTEWMVAQSSALDAAIAKKGVSPDAVKDALISTVGKHWVIDNALLRHPGMAENYGWHFEGPDFQGIKGGVTASAQKDPKTGAFRRLIQDQGWRHDPNHSDYSQNVVLVADKAELNGNVVGINDILTSPEFASLASHNGPLKLLRMPTGTVV